jgi:GTP cyclohydrolase I
MQTANSTEVGDEVASRGVALSLSQSTGIGLPRNPSQSREGYGFRPRSGLSTPQLVQDDEGRDVSSPIPDQYGLGWPGEQFNEVSRSATNSESQIQQQNLPYPVSTPP